MVGRRNPNPRGRATDPSKLGELRSFVDSAVLQSAAKPTVDQDMRDPTVELDADGVVQPDHADAPQKMGDSSVEVTEESCDASEVMGQAMEAMSEGKLEEAVQHLTKAILLNPTSAVIYSTRASVFIKMEKPAAAIGDANAALEMGDSSVEVTEESRDASQDAMGQAMEAMSQGKLEEAVQHLTKAILLNPSSATMYVYRASVSIKMKKPAAAFRDANDALKALMPHPLSSAMPSRSKPSARKRRKRTELLGVRELASGRFEAYFRRGKLQFQCGTHDTKEGAAKAREEMVLELGRSKAKKPKKIKSKKLQEKVKERQQHQLSGKLKEKKEECTALEKKVEVLELKLMMHQRLLLVEKELQEVLPPEGSSVAGGGHGHW